MMPNKLRVLVIAPFKNRHMELLQQATGNEAVFTRADASDSDELRRLLATHDVVIGEPSPELLAGGTSVRWIQMTWAGTDLYTNSKVPFPPGTRLTNVAGAAFGHIISQYVIGQILSIAQSLPSYVRQQQREEWLSAGPVMSIEGATVLIFGAGDIGTCTARRLEGFACHCIGVCRDTNRKRPPFERLVTLADAERELPRADIIVGCIPNTSDTARYLDARRLGLMKPGAILVNVGRGNFIDCDALAKVLHAGLIRGAALDVTEPEPLPKGHALWQEPRCVITPHQSGGSFGKCDETEDRICEICCENLRRWIAGQELTHVVI